MTSITMPQLGESVAEGTIGRWLKAAGDRVERDEPLVEVITDKVTAEIPSPVAGVVERIVVEEGVTVPIGREIAVIADEGAARETSPASASPAAAQSGQPSTLAGGEAAGPVSPPPTLAAPPGSAGEGQATAAGRAVQETPSGEGGGERRRASPLVRRLAHEYSVDLTRLQGSGAGGRVTKDDILAYVESRGARPTAAPPPTPPAAPAPVPTPTVAPPPAAAPVSPPAPVPTPSAPAAAGADEEYLPLSPMRRAIAEHMVRSRQTSPDAWSLVEVDVTSLDRLRQSVQADWQRREGFELTYLPFFIKAVVESLREHPLLNSSWGEDKIILKRRINIGVAVAVPDGLMVPVIHDADQKSIAGLAHAVRSLALRAREGKLGLAEVQGGTFTVNNTGALGSIMSQPIINQPQAAIITMEAVVRRPVVVGDDSIAIRSMMNACLSFDHRILDGAAALRFLQAVRRRLEAYGPTSAIY